LHLMLVGYLVRKDESADAIILTVVCQGDWKRLIGRPHAWLARMKNNLSFHNVTVEDATELSLVRPLWSLLLVLGCGTVCHQTLLHVTHSCGSVENVKTFVCNVIVF